VVAGLAPALMSPFNPSWPTWRSTATSCDRSRLGVLR